MHASHGYYPTWSRRSLKFQNVSDPFRWLRTNQTNREQDFSCELCTRILTSHQSPWLMRGVSWTSFGCRPAAGFGLPYLLCTRPIYYILHMKHTPQLRHLCKSVKSYKSLFFLLERWWWQLASWVVVRCCSTDFRCWDKHIQHISSWWTSLSLWFVGAQVNARCFCSSRFPGWIWIDSNLC